MSAAVAGHSTGRRKLTEQQSHAGLVLCDRMVNFRISSIQPCVRIARRTSMTGTDDADDLGIALGDDPVQVCIDEIETSRCSPMAQKPFLDVFHSERFSQKWICLKIDLSDSEVV